jgi:putative ATP-dependent DNA ligase
LKLGEAIAAARERNRLQTTRFGEWSYLRFTAKSGSMPEGTVVFNNDTVIWGYPKIGRIVQLNTGIPSQFRQAFWVEEKIDGYNARIFRYRHDILAITRRGYICPFTTDRLDDLINKDFFDDHPDLVLCAEVAGPENPYNEGSPPFIPEDVRLFVFDLMRKNRSGFVPHRDKMRLLRDYGIASTPQYGKFRTTDWESIKTLMLKLDSEAREGIVLKEDSSRDHRVKYVTGRSNISDIQVSDASIQQLPAEFYMHRVLRLVLFMEEHDIEPTPDLYRELGASLIDGALETVKDFREHHKVFHTFRCRFRQRHNAELMMSTMGERLGHNHTWQRRLEKQEGFYVLEFIKELPKSTGLLGHLLAGGVAFD